MGEHSSFFFFLLTARKKNPTHTNQERCARNASQVNSCSERGLLVQPLTGRLWCKENQPLWAQTIAHPGRTVRWHNTEAVCNTFTLSTLHHPSFISLSLLIPAYPWLCFSGTWRTPMLQLSLLKVPRQLGGCTATLCRSFQVLCRAPGWSVRVEGRNRNEGMTEKLIPVPGHCAEKQAINDHHYCSSKAVRA